jgi:thiamine-monophosphate kinase
MDSPDETAPVAGEFELIRRYFDRGPPRRALLGIGDDCAVLAAPRPGHVFAMATDMLVGGRHFFEDADPASVGHKALAVNLSDLAAMGAQPVAFTLAIALPDVATDWLTGFCRGLFELADRSGCELVGGDTTRGPLNITVTVIGEVPEGSAIRRDAAQPGDDLWVSGELGGAAFAVAETIHGNALPADHPARRRLDWPEPRNRLGLELRHLARAAIDVSDGLCGDLGHLMERSRVGAQVCWPDLPCDATLTGLPEDRRMRFALSGGDDYELLFTAASENREAIAALSARLSLRLTRIGRVDSGDSLRIVDRAGRRIEWSGRGFDHFA